VQRAQFGGVHYAYFRSWLTTNFTAYRIRLTGSAGAETADDNLDDTQVQQLRDEIRVGPIVERKTG